MNGHHLREPHDDVSVSELRKWTIEMVCYTTIHVQGSKFQCTVWSYEWMSTHSKFSQKIVFHSHAVIENFLFCVLCITMYFICFMQECTQSKTDSAGVIHDCDDDVDHLQDLTRASKCPRFKHNNKVSDFILLCFIRWCKIALSIHGHNEDYDWTAIPFPLRTN